MNSNTASLIDEKISTEKLESLTKEQLIKLIRALENQNRVYKKILDSQINKSANEISFFKKIFLMEPLIGDTMQSFFTSQDDDNLTIEKSTDQKTSLNIK
jgi:hypothetical protein